MALRAIVGTDPSRLNYRLVEYAVRALPAILIDCANAADPHRLYPLVDLLSMQRIYVFELELLHKFRDCLKYLPRYAKALGAKSIVVTTSDHLINYHNERENADLYNHAWQLMRKLGMTYEIMVGVFPDSPQYQLARKYCQELSFEGGRHGAHR